MTSAPQGSRIRSPVVHYERSGVQIPVGPLFSSLLFLLLQYFCSAINAVWYLFLFFFFLVWPTDQMDLSCSSEFRLLAQMHCCLPGFGSEERVVADQRGHLLASPG